MLISVGMLFFRRVLICIIGPSARIRTCTPVAALRGPPIRLDSRSALGIEALIIRALKPRCLLFTHTIVDDNERNSFLTRPLTRRGHVRHLWARIK